MLVNFRREKGTRIADRTYLIVAADRGATTSALHPRPGCLWRRVGVVALALARRLQVFVQIRLKGKGLVALGTFVILIRRMRLHMRSQIRAIGERLTAVSASVRFLAGVAAQVTLQ